ncbi:hypothetical protein ABIE18_001876 [Arthrobacter sp. 2762]
MLPYETNLAALRDGRYHARRAHKPVTLKIESGVSLEIPGPRLLAEVFALPWITSTADAYRSGAAILTRSQGSYDIPAPLHLGVLAENLQAALLQLPSLGPSQAGRPYRDLQIFLNEASSHFREQYLRNVVEQLRTLLPTWKEQAILHQSRNGAPRTDAERKASSRARIREQEEASARSWLIGFLTGWDIDEEKPVPGERILAAALHEAAIGAIEDFIESEEVLEDGTPFRRPTQRVFYAVADQLLGPRRRGANGSAMSYTIPSTSRALP